MLGANKELYFYYHPCHTIYLYKVLIIIQLIHILKVTATTFKTILGFLENNRNRIYYEKNEEEIINNCFFSCKFVEL